MNADGSNVVQLTSDDDWAPAWSPDGKKIAFCSDRDGVPGIYVMNADGSNVVRLTSDDDWAPAWSPDGKKIAFSSGWDSDHPGIYVMNADGTNVVQLTSEDDREPAWSPDGKKIAFSSDRDGNDEIYVMDEDGTNVVRLTINTALDLLPDWCLVQVMNPEVYDTNENGIIEKNEAGMAAKDYFDGKITKEQALEVLLLHFATQP
jgi:Tol biopolymer transport system component